MSFIRKHLKKKLKDPEYKKAWDESEEEYQLQRQIIAQLIEQRNNQGLTQAKLAEKLETTQSVIARIENGKQNITVETLENIASALGCRVKIIFEQLQETDESPAF
jgi:ribosome-binding protein aMBF1 (putative translation factor)